jgi:hypothetical protein
MARLSDERATPDPDAAAEGSPSKNGGSNELGLADELSGRRRVDERELGLAMTPSARKRLELVLDRPSSVPPATIQNAPLEKVPPPAAVPRESLPQARSAAKPHARFGEGEAKQLRRLARWVMLCGLLAASSGAIAGAGALLGRSGPIASVMIGVMAAILAGSLGVWLLSAGLSFWRAARHPKEQLHRFVDGLGLVRTALLLKAILLFSTMVLGCFSFSIAAALLLML